MQKAGIILVLTLLFLGTSSGRVAEPSDYLQDIKNELSKEWPDNRTINLVFHGHSVPAGYFNTPVVNTLESYPSQLLKLIKERYPFAVVNIIITAIGGEHSVGGAARFDREVLVHQPDVLFIDYALNDLGAGLEASHAAWSEMIRKAQQQGIKLILMTPSPDLRIDMLAPGNPLELHSRQIHQLSREFGIGLVDSYALFREKCIAGDSISTYMAQVNHPNERGHQIIAREIFKYFD